MSSFPRCPHSGSRCRAYQGPLTYCPSPGKPSPHLVALTCSYARTFASTDLSSPRCGTQGCMAEGADRSGGRGLGGWGLGSLSPTIFSPDCKVSQQGKCRCETGWGTG